LRRRAPSDIVDGFIDALATVAPAILGERREVQHELASLVLDIPDTKRRRHRKHTGYSFMHCRELRERFGREKFGRINERVALFDVTPDYSFADGSTRGYKLRPEIDEVVQRFYEGHRDKRVDIIKADGRRRRTPPGAIDPKTPEGWPAKAWSRASLEGAKLLNTVHVDLDRLTELIFLMNRDLQDPVALDLWRAKLGADSIEDARELLREHISQARRIRQYANTNALGLGYLMSRYQESRSGRLYAVGVNLQNACKLVKVAALDGCWEYDASNCHLTIISQLSTRHGLHCRAIADYTCSPARKREVRRAIADDVGISVEDVKDCILATVYGAPASHRTEDAIPSLVGVEKARTLYAHPLYAALKADLLAARERILHLARVSRGTIKNDVGCCISEKESRARRLAHLVQGAEAKMLRAIAKRHCRHIVLLQHDGFTSTVRLDPAQLTALVQAETGYRLEFEEQRLDFDSGSYDSRTTDTPNIVRARPTLSEFVCDSLAAGAELPNMPLPPPPAPLPPGPDMG
jgi:hypothetical protein